MYNPALLMYNEAPICTIFFNVVNSLESDVSMCVPQGTEKKGLCSAAWLAETVGLVLGIGAEDIGPLEGGYWPPG